MICAICGSEFTPQRKRRTEPACSQRCQHVAYMRRKRANREFLAKEAEAMAARRAADPEKYRRLGRECYARNPAKAVSRQKKYVLSHSEQVRQYQQKWARSPAGKASHRRYVQTHRESVLQRKREWYYANKERQTAKAKRRWANIKLQLAEVQKLRQKIGGRPPETAVALRVRELRAARVQWEDIPNIIARETGEHRTVGAYKQLVKRHFPRSVRRQK